MSKGIEKIMNKEIFATRFTWDDALECMDAPVVRLLENLPSSIVEEIAEEATYSISKGLEAGLMADWQCIMETAISNADLLRPLLGKEVVVIKDQDSFTGKIVGVNILNNEDKEALFTIIDGNGKIHEVTVSELVFPEASD